MTFDDQLERAQADGRITPGDADEVRRFAGYLEALHAAGVRPGDVRSPQARAIYLEHYPEYAPTQNGAS